MSEKIVCICATLRRAAMLRNMLACYRSQTFHRSDAGWPPPHLLICDDDPHPASGWKQQEEYDFTLYREKRFETLGRKHNYLVQKAAYRGATIVAVMDDDDIYLPNHLANIWQAAHDHPEADFFRPSYVGSNYGFTQAEKDQGKHEVKWGGRKYHGSWAFRVKAWERVGRYPDADKSFDTMFGQKISQHENWWYEGPVAETTPSQSLGETTPPPTYVYRWHGGNISGSPNDWTRNAIIRRQPCIGLGALTPIMDAETMSVFGRYGFQVQDY